MTLKELEMEMIRMTGDYLQMENCDSKSRELLHKIRLAQETLKIAKNGKH